MLKCRDITVLVSDYVDGRLKWRKRLSLSMHLVLCPPCRHFMGNFRLAVKLLQGQPQPQLRQATLQRFDHSVQEALAHRKGPGAPTSNTSKP